VDATTGFLLDSLCANKWKKLRENGMPGFKQEVRAWKRFQRVEDIQRLKKRLEGTEKRDKNIQR
jgi:hypothetical protein